MRFPPYLPPVLPPFSTRMIVKPPLSTPASKEDARGGAAMDSTLPLFGTPDGRRAGGEGRKEGEREGGMRRNT